MKTFNAAGPQSVLRNSRGISLTEVLVSLVVLSVGALGNAALHASFMKTRNATLFRLQAANLAADMVERIRANPSGRGEYEFNGAIGVSKTLVTCATEAALDSKTCTSKERAKNDLLQWASLVSAALTSDTVRTIQYDESSGVPIYTIAILRGSRDSDGNDLTYSIRFQP